MTKISLKQNHPYRKEIISIQNPSTKQNINFYRDPTTIENKAIFSKEEIFRRIEEDRERVSMKYKKESK